MNESKTSDNVGVGVIRGAGSTTNGMTVIGQYTAQCFGPDGQLKWEETFDNLVTDEGKKFLLDQALAGVTNTLYRMFVFTGGTPASTGTYGGPLVTEATSAIVNSATRNSITWVAASGAGSVTKGNTGTPAVFTIGAYVTVAVSITGAAVVAAANNASISTVYNTADQTTTNGGKLYSAGTFTAAKSVTAGDVLNVTYTTSLS